MKKTFLTCIAAMLLFAGSLAIFGQDNVDGSRLSSDHKILSFEHENLVDVKFLNDYREIKINEYLTVCQMSLIWETGTNLTSLAPVITIPPKAYIIPNPDIPQDFSEQVDYTVVAEDGSSLTYLIHSKTEDQMSTRGTKTITIDYSPKNGGTTSPAQGTHQYDENTVATIYANPAIGFSFERWYVGGYAGSIFSPLIHTVTADIGIVASFTPNGPVTVNVESEDTNKGTVSPPTKTVTYGGSIDVSATPKQGWAFEGWYRDGSKVSGSANMTYTPNPMTSCTLTAKFRTDVSISGPSELYLGYPETFSVTNAPAGFTWDKSSNFSLSGSGSSVTVTASSGSSGWISINLGADELYRYYIYYIISCAPVITGIDGPDNVVTYTTYDYYINLSTGCYPGTVTYTWNIYSGSHFINTYSNTDNHAYINFYTPWMSYCLEVSAFNKLGGSNTYKYIYASDYSPSPPAAYPNPVDDILMVEVSGQDAQQQAKSANITYDIRLYDVFGALRHQITTKNNSTQINVSNLPNGFYYLHIYDGVSDKPDMRTIVVKH